MKKILNIFWKNRNKIFVYFILYLISTCIIYFSFFKNTSFNEEYVYFRGVIIFFATVLLAKYILYITVSPFYNISKIISKRKKKYNPTVSVIVPAWNEEMGILTTINSLLKSSYKNLEIIVINDGSTDGSDKILTNFKLNYDLNKERNCPNFIYHYKKNGGKGDALNAGIAMSKGSIIISIDADCYVEEETIENFVKAFQDRKVMAAVGKVYIGNTQTIIGVVQYLEFLFSFYFKKADSIMNAIYIIGGAAGAFRREIFTKLGMYNTTNITEDIELSMRIQNAGYKIVYADDAIVYTEGATSLAGLMKQRLRWKRGRLETFGQFKNMFFSFNHKHKFILCWIILPISIFGELQMFMEPIFIIALYTYCFLTNDFISFVSGMLIVSTMFYIIFLFDNFSIKNMKKSEFLILAPISWLLFYIATFVEFVALIQSVWGILKKKEIKWQKWDRVGVDGK